MKIHLAMKLHVPTSGEVGNYYIAHERGARTCTPQGCINSWEMSRHAIGANTPHPLLHCFHPWLLLWAEPSFPSMCNPAEPKQSAKAFDRDVSVYSCITHFVGYCGHRSACVLNVPGQSA